MEQPKVAAGAPVHSIVMRPEWLRAIAKAASSLRFTANNWDWVTEPARQESMAIADTLTEIENAIHHGNLLSPERQDTKGIDDETKSN